MNKEQISEAFDRLNDDIIEEAFEVRENARRRRRMKLSVAAAACVLLLLVGAFLWKHIAEQSKITPALPEKGVTIPKMQVDLSSGSEADMTALFIYKGNCYVEYDWIENGSDVVGKRLGTATGLIDEWTPRDGYVELAGSVAGDFYEVKGYDPSFMLCMNNSEGWVTIYICNTGVTLKNGSEVYTERLHILDYESIRYETRDSWYYGRNEFFELNGNDDVIRAFIDELNAAEFMLCDSVPAPKTGNIYHDLESYHMFFRMKNGVTVHIRLLDGGYVIFDGIPRVCVRVSEGCFERITGLLSSGMD